MDRIATTRVRVGHDRYMGQIEFELPPEPCRRLFLAGAIRYCKQCQCFHICPDEDNQIEGLIYALKCLAVRSNIDNGPGATRYGHPAEGIGAPHEIADEQDLDLSVLDGSYRKLWHRK